MRSIHTPLTVLLAWLAVPITAGTVKYNATWESLDSRPLPTWYDDAKFGIFIHWGVYSVPAFGEVGKQYAEWYWQNLLGNPNGVTAKFHNKTYGADYHYTSFVDHFKAELFDPDAWADLFVKSGAKYVVPTSKHHEGFTLWPSAQSWNWNAVDVGPHRDLLGDIMNSVRKAGLHAGVYFSVYEWFHRLYTSNTPKMYVDQVLVPQWHDLISTYKPDLLWCDGEWDHDSDFWESKPFLQWLYNDSPVADTIVINDRFGSDTRGKHGGYYTAEYSSDVWLTHKWEENSAIDVFSYGFNRATPEAMYFTAEYLLNLLVRTVSNNGNLLLDIGPAADGTIPTVMQQRLLEMGEWLSVNGEGIYSTRPWRIQQDGSIDATNIRYTYSPVTKATYAFMLKWPEQNQVTFLAPITFNNTVVTMLGVQSALKFESSGVGLTITLPFYTPNNPVKWIWCFKLENVQ